MAIDDVDVEIDSLVSDARAIANHLNHRLAALESLGVECVSVIGAPPRPQDMGLMREISRVSLVLNFKAVAQD